MITTEAMALLAGRQAYRVRSLPMLVGDSGKASANISSRKQTISLRRRQLIFSSWVLVMTDFEESSIESHTRFERSLVDPAERFQKMKPLSSRKSWDWATKYHVGLAPVYYFSYLLGELFASSIEERFPVFAIQERRGGVSA